MTMYKFRFFYKLSKKLDIRISNYNNNKKYGFNNASYSSKNSTQNGKNDLLKMMRLNFLVQGLKLVELFHQLVLK